MQKDINEIWLAIEDLNKNSHPPVDWLEIINSLIARVEELEKDLGYLKSGGIGQGKPRNELPPL